MFDRNIPAFLSIDVEPDGFQLSRSDPATWTGYESILPVMERLRSNLLKRSGVKPKFGWYFRMDPQVAEVYGRPDFVWEKYPDSKDQIRERGDYFGVHSHPVRWSNEQNLWIHDFADPGWDATCAKFALDAYAERNESPARRFRGGAGFLTNQTLEVLDQCGVKVDLTLEPVDAWPASFSTVPSGIDESPYVGVHSDYRSAPRTAYRPARNDFRVPDAKNGRALVMVPMATYVRTAPQPFWRGALQRFLRQAPQGKVRVLHLSEPWPNAKLYWDLVSKQIQGMRRPYLSLAIRTDAPGSSPIVHALKLLDSLSQQPLSKRLHFLDPLEIASSLV